MTKKTKVYFRADGGPKIGVGHVIRSLALAEMISSRFECHFIIRNVDQDLKKEIDQVCTSVIILSSDIENEAQFICVEYLTSSDIVVLDGYKFDTEYQKTIKNNVKALVCIDDILAYHFVCDALINHAGGIKPEMYSSEKYTQYYLGLKHALLRKEFRNSSMHERIYQKENSVFICLGGADPNNNTMNVLEIVKNQFNVEKYYVVVGFSNSSKEEIIKYIDDTGLKAEILINLSPQEMVFYMSKCKTAITSPSTISYEFISNGGLLYLYLIADNQKNNMAYFLEAGIAFRLEDYPISESEQKASIQRQSKLIDSNIKNRYLELFKSLEK